MLGSSKACGVSFDNSIFHDFLTVDLVSEEVRSFTDDNDSEIEPIPPSYVLFAEVEENIDDEYVFKKALEDTKSKRKNLLHKVSLLWNSHLHYAYLEEVSPLTEILENEEGMIAQSFFQKLADKLKINKKDNAIDKVYESFVKALKLDKSDLEVSKKERHIFTLLWKRYQKKVTQEVALAFIGRKNVPKILQKEFKVESDLDFVKEKLTCNKVSVEKAPRQIVEVRDFHPDYLQMKERVVSENRIITLQSQKMFHETAFVLTACGKRPYNEDRTLIEFFSIDIDSKHRDISCYAVFDGHAGKTDIDKCTRSSDCVDFVKKIFIDILKEKLTECDGFCLDLRIYNALTQTFLEVQKKWTQHVLLSMNNTHTNLNLSGTTANVVIRIDSNFYCANLGDSRAIISFADGYYPLSVDMKCDQSPYSDIITTRGGEVLQKDGDCHRLEGNLAMAGALGDISLKALIHRPDIKKVHIHEEDLEKMVLYLASDGIWDVITSADLCRFGESSTLSSTLATCIMQTAYFSNTHDNTTVLVTRFAPKE